MLRFGHHIAAASVLLSRITGTLAADQTIEFLYPVDDGLTYHYLDRVDVSFLSNYSAPYLYTWCDPDDVWGAQSDRPDAYNSTTEITLQFTSDVNLECWFNLREYDYDTSSDKGTNSVHWTFDNTTREGGPATLGLATATGSSTISVSTPTASSRTTVIVTASAEPTSTGTSSLSSGAKAGIGVGVAIGAIAVAAAAGAFLFRRRKRRNQAGTNPGDMGGRASPPPMQSMAELEEQQGAAEMGVMSHSQALLKGKYAPVGSESPPQELPAEPEEVVRHELPAVVDREDR